MKNRCHGIKDNKRCPNDFLFSMQFDLCVGCIDNYKDILSKLPHLEECKNYYCKECMGIAAKLEMTHERYEYEKNDPVFLEMRYKDKGYKKYLYQCSDIDKCGYREEHWLKKPLKDNKCKHCKSESLDRTKEGYQGGIIDRKVYKRIS